MPVLVCEECGLEFEMCDAKEIREYHDGYPYFETFIYCPYCGSDRWHEVGEEEADEEDEEGEEDV